MGSDSTLFSFTLRAELAGRTTLHTFRLARFGAMRLSPPGFPLWVRHLLWRFLLSTSPVLAGILTDVYAAHLSLTSVLCPGRAFICWAFTSSSVRPSSRTLKTGRQRTPVLSIAT